MIGKIIGIRTVRTSSSYEPQMITDSTKRIAEPTITNQSPNTGGCVYLLIDCSASMAGDKICQAREGTLEFARKAMKDGLAVGVIGFGSSATQICGPGSALDGLKPCLDRLDASGSTNLTAAISLAHKNLEDFGRKKVIVVATDGRPDSSHSALQAARTAKDDEIDIITIGTDDADLAFLQKLASNAEMGNKVPQRQFREAIASAFLLLPAVTGAFSDNSTGPRPARHLQYCQF